MNLLMERGEKDGNAKVYAFNTFFYPKILGGGQSAVKRWTRRVDIFAHDYLLIPVHLGMHWCLAVSIYMGSSWRNCSAEHTCTPQPLHNTWLGLKQKLLVKQL